MEKESSIIITLSHLADLALGSPELGAVNFNVLHTLLQVMIRQMNLDKTQVEFRGSDYDRIKTVMKSAPSSPTLKLSEYILNIEDSEGNITKISSKDTKKPEKKHKEKPTSEAVQEAKTEQKQEESGEIEPAGSVILVEQAGDKDKQGKVIDRQVDKEKPKIEVSQEDIEKVNKKMSHLEKQVQDMQSIPSNEELINRTRSSSQTTPVNDMWQIMNITKRMDAAEDCVNKLTSMVEDLAKGTDTTGKTSDDASKPSTKPPSIFERLDSLENRISKLEQNKGVYSSTQSSDTTEPSSGTKQAGGAPINYDNMTTDQVLTTLRKELEQIRYEVDNIESQIKQVTSIAERIPCQDFLDGLQEVQDLKTKMETFTAMLKDKAELLGGEEEELEGGSPRGLVRQLEDKINMCEEQVEDMRNFFTALLKDVHTQISKLEKELGEMNEEVHSATLVGGEYSQDPVGMSDICNTIRVIQEDLQNLNQTAIREMDDRLEKEMHIKALLEQIEILKSIKADREDLEDALAEKADQNMVNRKVSYDQFDAACDDLSKGLDEALAKLTEQESLWQQVLDGVQREIENKLDKIELPQLKDFVNSKLKTIQQRLKEIASMRKESEAAGTKLKLLRNVNCISCNSDVVMKTERETPSIPAPDPMPASRNMRPYLTYELDMVRKQQRRPHGKNMLYLEEVEREKARKMKGKEGVCPDSRSLDHLCNRYCGGSHTTTTPHQRVTRMGHFLTQWGPEAIQLTEGTIRGTDGQMYRTRTLPEEVKDKIPSKTLSSSDVELLQKELSQTSGSLSKRRSSTLRKKSASPAPESPAKKMASLTTTEPLEAQGSLKDIQLASGEEKPLSRRQSSTLGKKSPQSPQSPTSESPAKKIASLTTKESVEKQGSLEDIHQGPDEKKASSLKSSSGITKRKNISNVKLVASETEEHRIRSSASIKGIGSAQRIKSGSLLSSGSARRIKSASKVRSGSVLKERSLSKVRSSSARAGSPEQEEPSEQEPPSEVINEEVLSDQSPEEFPSEAQESTEYPEDIPEEEEHSEEPPATVPDEEQPTEE